MMGRVVVVAALALSVTLGAIVPPAISAADWTPIEPVTSGCPDDGWTLRAVDAATVRAVFPIIADWQLGTFTIDGHPRPFRVVRQVIDEPYCQGFRATVTAPWDGDRTVRYRWRAADGTLLEWGSETVRR